MQARNPKFITSILTVLLGMALAAPAAAQQTLTPAPRGNKVKVDGTSSVHDWSVKSHTIKGSANLPEALDTSTSLAEVGWLASKKVNPKIVVHIPVKTLTSGKDGMDENMYEAFHANKNPTITFDLDHIWAVKAESTNEVKAQASGKLTMAGKTKDVLLNVKIYRKSDGSLEIKGRHKIDMRHYGIEPPTAMLGMMKTGPTVHVSFDWILQK